MLEQSGLILGNIGLNILGGYASSYGLTMTVPDVPLSPPTIVFPITWTVLYILLGIGSTLISNRGLLGLYYFHLGLNFIWSVVFFGIMYKEIAAAIISVMIVIICIIMYYEPNVRYIFSPYILWLLFALYLNIASI